MFELSPKLRAAKIVVTWKPDDDFFPDGVTFDDPPSVSIEIYRSSPVRDDNPGAMLSGGAQLSDDKKQVLQLLVDGTPGAKYVLTYLAPFSDGVQRDGVRALIEVE